MARETKKQIVLKKLKRFKSKEAAVMKHIDLGREFKISKKGMLELIDIVFVSKSANDDLFGDEPKTKVKAKEKPKAIPKKKVPKVKKAKRTPTQKKIEKPTKNVQDFIKDAEAREERRKEFDNLGLERQGVCPKCVSVINMRVSGSTMNSKAYLIMKEIETQNEHLSERDRWNLIDKKVKVEQMYDSHVSGDCPKCKVRVMYTEFTNWDTGHYND
jgi:hypothetical protein